MILFCLRCTLQPSATETSSFRSDTSTSGSAISPTACMILCVRFTCFVRSALAELRHRRNTRYGWVANPYPTGTCTLQDAPSFAWRANACGLQAAGERLYPAGSDNAYAAVMFENPLLIAVRVQPRWYIFSSQF